jgi:hypothetical protein
MNISNLPMTSTGTVTNEFHGAEVQTMNHHSLIPKASEEIE